MVTFVGVRAVGLLMVNSPLLFASMLAEGGVLSQQYGSTQVPHVCWFNTQESMPITLRQTRCYRLQELLIHPAAQSTNNTCSTQCRLKAVKPNPQRLVVVMSRKSQQPVLEK